MTARRKSTLIRHSLINGPRSMAELARETGLPYGQVQARIARLHERGRVVRRQRPDGGFAGWGLS